MAGDCARAARQVPGAVRSRFGKPRFLVMRRKKLPRPPPQAAGFPALSPLAAGAGVASPPGGGGGAAAKTDDAPDDAKPAAEKLATMVVKVTAKEGKMLLLLGRVHGGPPCLVASDVARRALNHVRVWCNGKAWNPVDLVDYIGQTRKDLADLVIKHAVVHVPPGFPRCYLCHDNSGACACGILDSRRYINWYTPAGYTVIDDDSAADLQTALFRKDLFGGSTDMDSASVRAWGERAYYDAVRILLSYLPPSWTPRAETMLQFIYGRLHNAGVEGTVTGLTWGAVLALFFAACMLHFDMDHFLLFIHRLARKLLLPGSLPEKNYVLYGEGGAGKDQWVGLLAALFGHHNSAVVRRAGDLFDAHAHPWLNMVLCVVSDANIASNDERTKSLLEGGLQMVNPKNVNQFKAVCYALFVVTTNNRVKGSEKTEWSRRFEYVTVPSYMVCRGADDEGPKRDFFAAYMRALMDQKALRQIATFCQRVADDTPRPHPTNSLYISGEDHVAVVADFLLRVVSAIDNGTLDALIAGWPRFGAAFAPRPTVDPFIPGPSFRAEYGLGDGAVELPAFTTSSMHYCLLSFLQPYVQAKLAEAVPQKDLTAVLNELTKAPAVTGLAHVSPQGRTRVYAIISAAKLRSALVPLIAGRELPPLGSAAAAVAAADTILLRYGEERADEDGDALGRFPHHRFVAPVTRSLRTVHDQRFEVHRDPEARALAAALADERQTLDYCLRREAELDESAAELQRLLAENVAQKEELRRRREQAEEDLAAFGEPAPPAAGGAGAPAADDHGSAPLISPAAITMASVPIARVARPSTPPARPAVGDDRPTEPARLVGTTPNRDAAADAMAQRAAAARLAKMLNFGDDAGNAGRVVGQKDKRAAAGGGGGAGPARETEAERRAREALRELHRSVDDDRRAAEDAAEAARRARLADVVPDSDDGTLTSGDESDSVASGRYAAKVSVKPAKRMRRDGDGAVHGVPDSVDGSGSEESSDEDGEAELTGSESDSEDSE